MDEDRAVNKSSLNYPGNTHKMREKARPAREDKGAEKVPVEKVITGEVVQRKKPLGRKIAETFKGEDMGSVGSYVLFDVLIPAAKAMLSDAVSQGVERLFFGDARRSSSRSSQTSYTSYNRMGSGSSRSDGRREVSYRSRAVHDFSEIILSSRGEAENVIDRLGDLIENYDVATVNDLYDLVGITGSFTDDKWGWADIRGASATRVREGYLLNLPKTTPID
jgi:hypothetical protein